MPGIAGEVTDFKNKWNADLKEKLLRLQANRRPDGEYIDSSEGYVTDELDFRREHFAAARHAPDLRRRQPQAAIFRG